jgi:hypothetical protein
MASAMGRLARRDMLRMYERAMTASLRSPVSEGRRDHTGSGEGQS